MVIFIILLLVFFMVIFEDILLIIVYEDEYLVVIYKLVGMVVYFFFGYYSGIFVNVFVYCYGILVFEVRVLMDGLCLGIVYCLDWDIMGLIVVVCLVVARDYLFK